MDKTLLFLVLLVAIQSCYCQDNNKPSEVDEMCMDLIQTHASLRTINPSECKFSHKSDRLTCTVRLMSESIPYNVTSVDDTDFSSLVRVNLDYVFRFRVLGVGAGAAGSTVMDSTSHEAGVTVRRRCLVLTGVSFRRILGSAQQARRTKVLLPSRLFHLAANSALLGADSEVDSKSAVPAGVVTLTSDCGGRAAAEKFIEQVPAGEVSAAAAAAAASGSGGSTASSLIGGETFLCVRSVGVSLPEAAAQLDLALLAFNYSFFGAGFPDRSDRGKSVARSLPANRLQRLHLRGGGAGDVEPPPELGAEVTELDLSHTAGHNFSSWEPRTQGLQRVSLSHSDLRMVPNFVQRQSALRGLALDGNSALLRSGGPSALRDSLAGLTELQDLQLAGVRTEILTSETLPPLPSLLTLNMSGCGVRRVAGDAFRGLPALQRLDLSSNLLVRVPSDLAVPCPKLRHLNLARNKLVKGPRLILSLLHELDLAHNALQSVDDVVSEGRVVRLKMSHNIVRSVDGARFSSWAERVDLSHNLVSAVGLRVARRDLEGLVALDLRGNRIDCSSCATIELQMWLNETSVLLTPPPSDLRCGGGDEDILEEGSTNLEKITEPRVLDIHLPECTPAVDYALLIVAPVAAALALGAALLALVCVRRAGWLGVCSLCGYDDESNA